MNFRGEENSYGLVPSSQSAPRGPPAAWKPHPAGFQEGCAKHSSGTGNVATKPMPERVDQTREEAWVSGYLPSTLHAVSFPTALGNGASDKCRAAQLGVEAAKPLSGSFGTQTVYSRGNGKKKFFSDRVDVPRHRYRPEGLPPPESLPAPGSYRESSPRADPPAELRQLPEKH